MKIRIKGTAIWADVVCYTSVDQDKMIIRFENGEEAIFDENQLTYDTILVSFQKKTLKLYLKCKNKLLDIYKNHFSGKHDKLVLWIPVISIIYYVMRCM